MAEPKLPKSIHPIVQPVSDTENRYNSLVKEYNGLSKGNPKRETLYKSILEIKESVDCETLFD